MLDVIKNPATLFCILFLCALAAWFTFGSGFKVVHPEMYSTVVSRLDAETLSKLESKKGYISMWQIHKYNESNQ